MKNKLISTLCFILLITAIIPVGMVSAASRINRALVIVNGDYPGTENDLTPGPETDAKGISSMFKTVGMDTITAVNKQADTEKKLKSKINEAFGESKDGDYNYLYYSGHGVSQNDESFLSLIGGQVSTDDLKEMFEGIKGTNVIILDCCFSGGFINKNLRSIVSRDMMARSLAQDGFKVITASSLEELSYQMGDTQHGAFTASMLLGCGINPSTNKPNGEFPADANADGRISFDELYEFTKNFAMVSAVRMYPENDKSTFMEYNGKGATIKITDLDVSYKTKQTLSFTIDAKNAEKATYQIIKDTDYSQDAIVNSPFEKTVKGADLLTDSETFNVKSGQQKITLPLGSKVKSDKYYLRVSVPSQKAALIVPFVVSAEGVEMDIYTEKQFKPKSGEELLIHAECFKGDEYYQKPSTSITCEILDSEGKTIRTLGKKVPLQVVIDSRNDTEELWSYKDFYWDGRNNSGYIVSSGKYQVVVTAYTGSSTVKKKKTVTLDNSAFVLLGAKLKSDTVVLKENETADLTVKLAKDAKVDIVEIETGTVLITGETLKKGTHEFKWDFTTLKGVPVSDGNYTLRVTATNGKTKQQADSFVKLVRKTPPTLFDLRCEFTKEGVISKKYPLAVGFSINTSAEVTAAVYDDQKNVVYVLSEDELVPEGGDYVVYWEGTNEEGETVPEGEYKVYIYAKNSYGKSATKSIKVYM